MSFLKNFLGRINSFAIAPLAGIRSNNVTARSDSFASNLLASWLPTQLVPVRTRYVNWQMLRDVKRRRMVKEYATIRLRVNAIRKNTLVPKEIQEIADREIKAFPRDSCRTRLVRRCMLTSRPRGVVSTHRVSRIMFRLLADYNKLSGVIRAKW